MFIVFDGLDGGGKTTQIQLLAEWFRRQDRDVVLAADPGSTELGERLREILLQNQGPRIDCRAEMLLFSAARAQLVEQVIRPALELGSVVLLDRYILSTVVYQGYAGDLDPDDIRLVNRIGTGNLWPRMTFILDLPVEHSLERLGDDLDRMESRGADYFQRVRQGFLDESADSENAACLIDATGDVEAIHAQVVLAVKGLCAVDRREA